MDLRLGLGASGELKRLQLAEHFHVALELELGGLDDISLRLTDFLSLKSHTHFRILLLNLLSLLLVLHVLTNGELVVLSVELDPFARLSGIVDDVLLVLDLTFTEKLDVLLLVLRVEGLKLLLVQLASQVSGYTSRCQVHTPCTIL